MSGPTPKAQVGSALTDGTGISALTSSKLVKDFVVDFLITASASLAAVNIMSLNDAVAAPQIVATAIGGALIRVAYRFILKWASS